MGIGYRIVSMTGVSGRSSRCEVIDEDQQIGCVSVSESAVVTLFVDHDGGAAVQESRRLVDVIYIM